MRTATVLLPLVAACSAPTPAPEAPAPPPAAAPGPDVQAVAPARPAAPAPDPVALAVREPRPTAARPRTSPAAPRASVERAAVRELPLRSRLRRERVPALVVRDEESLGRVVEAVRNATGLPLVVAPAAERAVLDAGVVFDLALEHPLRVVDVLNLIERACDGAVRWSIRHDAVIFDDAGKAAATPKTLRLYDIRSLTFARTDFVAPRIDRIRLLDELEDDDGGGPFGAVGEHVSQLTPDEVLESVMESVAPGTWEQDGVSIELGEGFLIVVHEPAVQARVGRFLSSLGAY